MDSLVQQHRLPHEVIIVHQDADPNYIAELEDRYAGLLPITLHDSIPGLSRARNAGLKLVSGDVVGFPDDDCWYHPALLTEVRTFFAHSPDWDGLHGVGINALGIPIARFAKDPGIIKPSGVFQRSCSIAMYYRSNALSDLGGFDERLGLGSGTRWLGCEDYDLPIRLTQAGARIYFDPSIATHHALPGEDEGGVNGIADGHAGPISSDKQLQLLARVASQAPSYGYLIRRHRLPRACAVREISRPLLGSAVAIMSGRLSLASLRLRVGLGRARGYYSRSAKAADGIDQTSDGCVR